MVQIFLIIAAAVGQNPYQVTFERACAAYSKDDYSTAVQLFEQLITEHVVHPFVFYDLGNAYYRSGRIGPAIANYERALQQDPHFDNARQNLNFCLRKTQRRLEKPAPPVWEQTLLFWHTALPPAAIRNALIVVWAAFWSLLVLREWRPVPGLRAASVMLGSVILVLGLSAWAKSHPPLLAVASESRAPVRYGPDDKEAVHFELLEGDRVLVEARDQGWARVATADGNRGWMPQSELTLVGPPYEPAPGPDHAGKESNT
ncbi:MAG: tetratricopeptide repeat protein [Candidatus Hydrogenedentes bacterium]|nr:tetratricopeptide repeat protein [Candidatus Hydrogenedentota bacterium]